MVKVIYRQSLPIDSETLSVEVRRDGRLRKYVRWSLVNGQVLVRVPRAMSEDEVRRLMDEELLPKIKRQRLRAIRQNDADLEARARHINETYFEGAIRWHSIRWVGNMSKRLGSFSHGGTTDGTIRISDRIKTWPDYVIDYVVAHELAHRLHPNHSPEFWAYLARYPDMERARGFIEGVAFSNGLEPDALL